MKRMVREGFKTRCCLETDYLDRERLIMEELSMEAASKLRMLVHSDHQIGVLAAAISGDSTGLGEYWKGMTEAYTAVGRLIAPWYDWDESAESEKQDLGTLKANWEAAFGKLDSPEVQKEIERMKAFKPAHKPDETFPRRI